MKESNSDLIDKICDMVVSGDIVVFGKVLGVVLTGSTVHGVRHPNSDIDLHIIVDSEKNIIQYFCCEIDNIIVQMKIYPFTKYKADCMVHERRRPAAYACKILYDPTRKCNEYLELSREFLFKGPQKMTSQEKAVLLTTLKSEIMTAEGLLAVGKIVSATLIMNDLVRMVVSYYNDENNYWISNDNYLFSELKEHNLSIGELAEKVILCSDINLKLILLKELCHKAIQSFDDIQIGYSYEEKYD